MMGSASATVQSQTFARRQLDLLFVTDASLSLLFGGFSLLAPHGVVRSIGGGFYNHDVHEVLRLYGCLRIACGWILYNIRLVDDGRFRRSVCEGLCACYLLQAAAVLRAQFTDRHTWLNWVAILVLSLVGTAYGAFRFGQGGNHIKIYELPTAGSLQ